MGGVNGSKKTILAIAGAVAVVGAGGFWQLKSKPVQMTPPATSQTVAPIAPAKTDYVTYQGEDGKNALELLKTKADIKTETSSYGEFVKSINGNDGGGQKYWTFFVEGKEAAVGAGAYTTKNNEKIEWKLQ